MWPSSLGPDSKIQIQTLNSKLDTRDSKLGTQLETRGLGTLDDPKRGPQITGRENVALTHLTFKSRYDTFISHKWRYIVPCHFIAMSNHTHITSRSRTARPTHHTYTLSQQWCDEFTPHSLHIMSRQHRRQYNVTHITCHIHITSQNFRITSHLNHTIWRPYHVHHSYITSISCHITLVV